MDYDAAERLARMRRRRGLSQGELARKLGLSRQAVSKWERGESSPDTDNLVALADLYDVSLDELVRATVPGERHGTERADAPADSQARSEPEGAEGDPATAPSDAEAGEGRAPERDRPCAAAADGEGESVVSPAPGSRPVRTWTRRAAVGLGVSAAFAAGAFLAWGKVPVPGGALELKSGIKRLLGRPFTTQADLNTAGVRNVVVEWPAGTVGIVSSGDVAPLSLEERSLDGTFGVSYLLEGDTLRIWSGDARGWDDPSWGHDLFLRLPTVARADERGRRSFAWAFETLTLNTASASFHVTGTVARRLAATLREGSLTDVVAASGNVFGEHALDVEELDLDVGRGTAHVRAGSRALKVTLDGGSAFVTLTDGARRAGESFAAQADVAGGFLCVRQPNPAEGWSARVTLSNDASGEARFASSFKGAGSVASGGAEGPAAAFSCPGDLALQTEEHPLVRTAQEIVYDARLSAGAFELYDSAHWNAGSDEPDRSAAAPLAP